MGKGERTDKGEKEKEMKKEMNIEMNIEIGKRESISMIVASTSDQSL